VRISGIYTILNIVNNKLYIGSAIYIKARINGHKTELNQKRHGNSYLQAAWNKYGANNFFFIILETIEDKTKLTEREQYYIDVFSSNNRKIGYNLRPFANNNIGVKHSEQTKLKLSKISRGRKLTEEAKIKLSLAIKGIKKSSTINMRKPKSEDHKRKLSLIRQGTKLSEETKIKIGNSGRDKSKWPCEDGNKCKCEKCKAKRNEYYRNKYPLYRNNLIGSRLRNEEGD